MPIAYNPTRPMPTLMAVQLRRTICNPAFIATIVIFLLLRLLIASTMSASDASTIDATLTYPATMVSSLFTFLIAFFLNNCFTRYMDNWHAAMIGWSRINDLGLQVYGYVPDRRQACDVMRLMHAANHLCYGGICV